MQNPNFSVIIPIKGRLEFVKEAIRSVYKQKDFEAKTEIIVVEDKYSTHSLKGVLKNLFPEITFIGNSYEQGPGGCRQTGLKHAKGKYVVFLDSDDSLKPSFLKEMSEVLDKNVDVSAVLCFSQAKFEPGFVLIYKVRLYLLLLIRNFILMIAVIFNKSFLYPQAFYLCQISHMMFRYQSIKDLQFNYDYYHGGEDWDFFTQLLNTQTIKILPLSLVNFRYSWGSYSYNNDRMSNKWQSYKLLASRIPEKFRRGILYKLFLYYINLFQTQK